MSDFLRDKTFLLKVNQHKIKHYSAAIMCLDFETENPIVRLEAKVISGNMSIQANSSTRRTGSLSLIFDNSTYNVVDVDNLIAIDKKISLSIGVNNPFFHTDEYSQYGETLWFKQGVFVITKVSVSIAANARTITINLTDKMAFLNGTCGGTLPASTSFHEQIVIDKDENTTVTYPLIKNIIKEAVHHFGGENYTRISVEDVDETGRIVLQYVGSKPISFAPKSSSAPNKGVNFVIGERDGWTDIHYKGENIGYLETDLTYPGELIMNAGSTVTQVLDEIAKTLGNFEYFYDVDGIFHFRKIQNFLATGNTPLNYANLVPRDADEKELVINQDENLWKLYLPYYTDNGFINEFTDTGQVISINFNPDYGNIKNDFIVWGSRQAAKNTSSTDSKNMVRYHLAIDSRPQDIERPTNIGDELRIGPYSLCHQNIYAIKDNETDLVIRYQLDGQRWDSLREYRVEDPIAAPALDDIFTSSTTSFNDDELRQVRFNWREELYRQALLAYGSSVEGTYYDEELLAEWREIYDPTNKDFKREWELHYGNTWTGYNVNIKLNPSKIRYWLDIIDTTSPIGKYSVQRIGRRSKVTENSKIDQIFTQNVNDIVFFEAPNDESKRREKIEYYISIGQDFCFYQKDLETYFTQVNSYGSCFEDVREMLYNNLIYNATVNISCIPMFYLDVNRVVGIYLPELGVVGNFVIQTISWQLGNSPSMNLTLNEAIVEI